VRPQLPGSSQNDQTPFSFFGAASWPFEALVLFLYVVRSYHDLTTCKVSLTTMLFSWLSSAAPDAMVANKTSPQDSLGIHAKMILLKTNSKKELK
jgi:hypothetical protein